LKDKTNNHADFTVSIGKDEKLNTGKAQFLKSLPHADNNQRISKKEGILN
jgi:hypothetical protein